MINMASFGDPDACPLTRSLEELTIAPDLKAEVDRLHRRLHREMETELLGDLALSRPGAILTLERIWQKYRKEFVTLMLP